MTDLSTVQIFLIAFIFAIAAIIHGAFGIGFAILPTAVMSFFMPMPEAVNITLWPNLLIIIFVVFTGGPVGRIVQRYWLLAVSALVGSALGAYLLFVVSQAALQLALALAIFITVYADFRGYNIHVPPDNRWLAVAFGLVAGAVGGSTNAMAPILLIYLFAVTRNKNELAQAANFCFLLGKIAQMFVIYRQPNITQPDLTLLALVSGVTVIGMFAGAGIRRKIPTETFRRIILLILLLLGVMLAMRAMPALLITG